MDGLINELIEAIKQEELLLQDFLDLLETQKMILVKNNHEAFEETVKRQEDLIRQIHDMEERRIDMVSSLAKDLNTDESELTLTRLVELSLGQTSDELRTVKQNVAGLVDRIKRANQVNQYLIKRSLNRTQRSIDFLIDSADLDVTYQQNGVLRNKEGTAVLVNRTM